VNVRDVASPETVLPAVSSGALPRRQASRRFYVGLSATCLAIAVAGFMPTYWLQLAPGTFEGPPLLHLHAWLFSAWPV
jgi:hypothetical protein